jgi:hypothetical protein
MEGTDDEVIPPHAGGEWPGGPRKQLGQPVVRRPIKYHHRMGRQ